MNMSIAKPEYGRLADYLKLARPDYWFKNIFMLPGMIMAYLYYPKEITPSFLIDLLLAIISTCFIASANYIINEWLDSKFDKYHPTKKFRTSVVKILNPGLVYTEYFLAAGIGLLIAFNLSLSFFYASLSLLIMGFFYNVSPFRTKEKAFIDVLSESINNPIRFALGWLVIVSYVFPPSSILLAYWMGGAFLMACKRFAEYRFINDKENAALYRKSFAIYTETNLLISIFFYALTASFFLGIFLIRHRIELLLTFPLFSFLFCWYLQITLSPNSLAQRPEKLYTNWKLMLFIILFFLFFMFLLFYRIDWMHSFLRNHFGMINLF